MLKHKNLDAPRIRCGRTGDQQAAVADPERRVEIKRAREYALTETTRS